MPNAGQDAGNSQQQRKRYWLKKNKQKVDLFVGSLAKECVLF